MRYSTLAVAFLTVAVAAAQVTGQLGNALITTKNPLGVSYQAVLQNKNTTGVRGYVAGTSNTNGTGVVFNVNLFGFTDEATFGPFMYHIHSGPVPSDGDCTGTLAHLDPFVRGEAPPCDATQPETCQVGDLSGKHGNITSTPFQTTYLDPYVSSEMGIGSFFGNRSLVVHSNSATRLNCANFTMVAAATGTTTSAPAKPTGGATTKVVSVGAVVAGVMAMLL